MSIFAKMHDRDGFFSEDQYQDLLSRLAGAMQHGLVEEVPVMIKRKVAYVENWYRDKETGDIYMLAPFNPPDRGAWRKVEMAELKSGIHTQ